ncbi:hypothetical protein Dda_6996 [Drechslerella dactyloides]|uniref:Uncharacterized protein n=1 Tax=Drechslerella dactyloides TaxID=74499 RepID=A0AAD6NH86_DREDA|nr:hypothetical protein Dda_6996 [Drechslerella dactyloides]
MIGLEILDLVAIALAGDRPNRAKDRPDRLKNVEHPTKNSKKDHSKDSPLGNISLDSIKTIKDKPDGEKEREDGDKEKGGDDNNKEEENDNEDEEEKKENKKDKKDEEDEEDKEGNEEESGDEDKNKEEDEEDNKHPTKTVKKLAGKTVAMKKPARKTDQGCPILNNEDPVKAVFIGIKDLILDIFKKQKKTLKAVICTGTLKGTLTFTDSHPSDYRRKIQKQHALKEKTKKKRAKEEKILATKHLQQLVANIENKGTSKELAKPKKVKIFTFYPNNFEGFTSTSKSDNDYP